MHILIIILLAHMSLHAAPEKDFQNRDYVTKKKELNIHGSLTTLRGKTYPISYALIGGKQRCVRVYTGPCTPHSIIPKLNYDPRTYKELLDLTQVKEITIPYPYATWFYASRGKHRGKRKYLLFQVTWHDKERSTSTYLVEKRRRISGIIEKEGFATDCSLPLSCIKTIHFKEMKK